MYKAVYNEVVKWQMAVINALLSHLKTDVNVQDIKGESALHRAPYGKHECALILSKLIERGADVSTCNLKKRTALHLASSQGDSSMASLQLLLDRGADVNATDVDGNTPLAFYLSRSWFSVDDNVCQLLLQEGIDPAFVNHKGLTLAHLYANCRPMKVSTLKILMELGVDMSV